MSVIIRLQNLPLTASSLDIRNFFHGLSIPDGGVHIVGGPEGDAFIAFSTDEDARQAMRLSGQPLKESRVSLLLSSRNEMYKVIEQARLAAMGGGAHESPSLPSASSSSHHLPHLLSEGSSPSSHHHLSSQVPSGASHLGYGHHAAPMSSMSPTSGGSNSNDYMKNFGGAGATGSGAQADLNSNPALLFSTMSAIPSATLGGGGAAANAFLQNQQQQQQQHQGYAGMGSSSGVTGASQSQSQASAVGNAGNMSFGHGANNHSAAAAAAAFANGTNPFMHMPPPTALHGMTLPFSGMLQGATSGTSGGVGGGSSNSMPHAGTLGITSTADSGVGGGLMSGNLMNTTMSMAGQGTSALNPFGTAPSRMSLMNNGMAGNVSNNLGPQTGSTSSLSGGPRHHNSSFGAGLQNQYRAGIGTGGPRQPQHGQGQGPRIPFGNHAATPLNHSGGGPGEMKNRFQFGAIPSGRAELSNARDGGKDRRNSPPRERRGSDPLSRRRRSRSRERDRTNDRRRRRSKSRSRSRSRSRDRAAKPSRRDSRDKRDSERKSRSDSSPEKSSQESGGRSRRDHESSPPPNSSNTTTEEWPGAKLTGVPSDASYREIKEFIRAEVMGGSDGVVRLYDEGIAYLKLQNPQEFPRVFRSNGRKLRGSPVSVEGITMETWTQEYKLNKTRIERDIDREKEEREKETEREKERESRRTDRDRDHRSDRHHSSHSSSSTSHHRSSRFSNASHQSSCIAIRGLTATITKHELATRYLQDTPCEDIVLIAAPTPTNRHSVTAFIQFENSHVAQSVIDLIARSPLGTTLVVESCDSEDLQKAKARTTGVVGGGVVGQPSVFGNTRVGQDTKSIFELDLGLDDETTTIIMRGAPPNITDRDVFDFFSDIGLSPMNVRILYDNDGQCNGQVICEFPDNKRAKRATTKDGMLFGRGQVSVSLLPSRNKRGGTIPGATGAGASIPPSAGTTGTNDYGAGAVPPNPFNRNQAPRQGLLGAGPRGGGPGSMPRFGNPTSSSPNIFEQALQQQSVPGSIRGGMGGGRGRGERMSRFKSVNERSDFRGQNGFGRGRGRGRGGASSHGGGDGNHIKGKTDQDLLTDDDLGIFNKKGCVIGLENIPYKASMDDILQYLEDTLKLRIAPNMIIRRYDDNQKPTGDARVAFNTEFEAKLACDRLKGTYMWKRLITATPDPDFQIDPPTPKSTPEPVRANSLLTIPFRRRLKKVNKTVKVEVVKDFASRLACSN